VETDAHSRALTYLSGSPVKEPSPEALCTEPLQREMSHSNKYWCSENALVVHEVPLHDLKCWSLVCSECSENQVALLFERSKFFLQCLVSSDIIL
jgi:hypothetical protein